MMKNVLYCGFFCAVLCGVAAAGGPPYQATGFKVGEVTDTTAIVWTRLTRKAERNGSDAPTVKLKTVKSNKKKRKPRVVAVEYPAGVTVADIKDAAPGVEGEVRVLYKLAGAKTWLESPWRGVSKDRDFTRQFTLTGLRPGARYVLRVESRGGSALEGGFVTAPSADRAGRVVFAVSTGQSYGSRDCPGGYKIYARILELQPSFFVHTGDIVYYDRLAKDISLARYHWQRTYSLPTNVAFHRQVGSYFIKDDHDTWQNDCWPTMTNDKMCTFTFAQGLAVFREQSSAGGRRQTDLHGGGKRDHSDCPQQGPGR